MNSWLIGTLTAMALLDGEDSCAAKSPSGYGSAMAIRDVVRRVEDDLAAGHSFVAIQRLTTLVQENPEDLELRRRLAAIHLATGNFVEAGQWSYLNRGSRDARATAAFEKAYRDPRALGGTSLAA